MMQHTVWLTQTTNDWFCKTSSLLPLSGYSGSKRSLFDVIANCCSGSTNDEKVEGAVLSFGQDTVTWIKHGQCQPCSMKKMTLYSTNHYKWKTSNLIEQYQNIVSFWGNHQIWKWLSKEINSRSKLDFHTDKQIDRWYWEPMNITCRFTSWKVCNTGSNQGCTIYTMHMYKEKYFANDLVTFEQKKLTSKDD